MTEEQIAALVKLEAQGNHSGFSSDFEAEARNILPRLLEERKRLLEALRPILERIDGDREFVCPDGGAEMIAAAHGAIAFAEEEAP